MSLTVRKISVSFLTHAGYLQIWEIRFDEKIIPYYSFSLLSFQKCGWSRLRYRSRLRYTPKRAVVLQSVIYGVRCLIFGLMMIQCIQPSIIRQNGESQNGCFKKAKHVKISKKRTFTVRVRIGFALLPYYRRNMQNASML